MESQHSDRSLRKEGAYQNRKTTFLHVLLYITLIPTLIYTYTHTHRGEAWACASTHAHASTNMYTHYKKQEDIAVML